MRFLSTVFAGMLGTLLAFCVIFFFLMLALVGLAAIGSQAPTVSQGSVLVVPASGVLPHVQHQNPFRLSFRDQLTVSTAARAIRAAADDERIRTLLLETRGIQNAWPALEELRDAVNAFSSSGKPVYAVSGANGFTEKDFYLASTADSVFSPPEARFELDGFYVVLQFMKRLFDKLEIEPVAVRAGDFKSATEPFTRTSASPENEAQFEAFLGSLSDEFVNAVAASRPIERDSLRDLIQSSRVRTGREAVENGLVDTLIWHDDLLSLLADSTSSSDDPKLLELEDYAAAVSPFTVGANEIAVVNIAGTIVSGHTGSERDPIFGAQLVGSADITETLRKLRRDDAVKAIVIRINSPGGSALASDVMWDAVRRTAASKPVIASLADVAASGGYYVAVAADTIVSNATTITGSIGAFSLFLDMSKFLEHKIGLTYDEVRTAPHADRYSGLRQPTEEELAMMASDIDDVYERFLSVVAMGRGVSTSDVEAFADGRIWSGRDAEERGLIDLIGGLQQAIEVAADKAGLEEDTYSVREYPPPKLLIEQLGDLLASSGARILGLSAVELGTDARLADALRKLHAGEQTRLPLNVDVY